jgi:hypothetical protein
MPARLVQSETHDSGTAQLLLSGVAIAKINDPYSVEIAIVQPGQADRFLDPRDQSDPWKMGAFFFRPLNPVRTEPAGFSLEIDHAVTYHLRAMTPYYVRVRTRRVADQDTDELVAQEVFTMPATTRRPSVRPAGWVEPPDPHSPAALPSNTASEPQLTPIPGPQPEAGPTFAPIAPAPAGAMPILETRTSTAASPALSVEPIRKPSSNARSILIGVCALTLLGAAAAAWYFLHSGDPSKSVDSSGVPAGQSAQPSAASAPASMDTCREALASSPSAEQARDWALQMAKDKRLLDCQFMLFRTAATQGDVVSARSLGNFYDPDTWSRESSPMPSANPLEAARWHKQAAEAGDIESMYRYGMLLKLGRTDLATDEAQQLAKEYLTKAKDAGHALAAAALTQ